MWENIEKGFENLQMLFDQKAQAELNPVRARYRSGYRNRRIDTRLGSINLNVPKPRKQDQYGKEDSSLPFTWNVYSCLLVENKAVVEIVK